MTEHDFYWFVGLLEGEGCFLHRSPAAPPRLVVQMKDEDVMRRVGHILERKVVRVHAPSQKRKGWAPTWRCTVGGAPALAWMERLQGHLGERRSAKIAEILRTEGRM